MFLVKRKTTRRTMRGQETISPQMEKMRNDFAKIMANDVVAELEQIIGRTKKYAQAVKTAKSPSAIRNNMLECLGGRYYNIVAVSKKAEKPEEIFENWETHFGW